MPKNSLAAVVSLSILGLVVAGCSNLSGVIITLGEETGALSGTVTDAATKNAIEDVQVTVSDKADVTDARGKYRIENLSVGNRSVHSFVQSPILQNTLLLSKLKLKSTSSKQEGFSSCTWL